MNSRDVEGLYWPRTVQSRDMTGSVELIRFVIQKLFKILLLLLLQ